MTTTSDDFLPDDVAPGEIEFAAPSQTAAAPTRARPTWVARHAHIVIPCLIILVLAAPSIRFMLPATQDYLDEIYQPMQALKFFATHGTAFHKYGPMENFVLAPGYALTLGYWKLTGELAHPAATYPFGFKHPFEQIGFLILQSRVIFLALGMFGIAYLAHTLRLVTRSRFAIGAALLFCVATNWALVWSLPSARPDSPMIAFAALALAVYVRILFLGMTLKRGIWMSVWAVCAISSKELAAPMFVLPYLGLIAMLWRQGERQPGGAEKATSAMVYSVTGGFIAYALLNIVYAPHTWVQRMRFWIGGPGIDADVWGGGGIRSRVLQSLGCVLDNFGPAGTLVVIVAVCAFIVARPRRWVLLALPAISVLTLGLSRIQYPQDRFFTIFALAMFPIVACGLTALLAAGRLQRARHLATTTILLLATINLCFATFTWHALNGTFEIAAERDVERTLTRNDSVSVLSTFARNPGSMRLDLLGYRNDGRSIQQIASQRKDLPRWIYSAAGKLNFIEAARTMPARAEMLRRESGFDIKQWSGLEGLGYALDRTIEPRTPVWFPFDWMPAVREWKSRRTVLVYRRQA